MTSVLPAEQWTSFRIPTLETLSRGRLTEQFTDCALGLAVAPPGFGKTTLLAEATRSHPGPVTWYRARPGTDEQELLTALGYPADSRGGLLAVPGQVRTARRRGGTGTARRLVVIDDMHLLAPAVRALVVRLGQLAPPHPRILIGSRPAAGLPVTALEAAGATVVDAEAMRFRSWEAERLFDQLYDTALIPGIALPLVRAADGRAAALRLFARAVAARPDAGQERILADGMFGREYLEREVLAPLPGRLRDFLEATCLLDRLTVTACQALTSQTDSRDALWSLTHDHGVLRADPDGRTYLAEPLLRDCLRARLAETMDGDELARLRGRAAACGGGVGRRDSSDHSQPPSHTGTGSSEVTGRAPRLRAVIATDPAVLATGPGLSPSPGPRPDTLSAALAPAAADVRGGADDSFGEPATLLIQGITAALTGGVAVDATLRRTLAGAGDDALVGLARRLTRAALAVLAAGPAGPVPYQELQRIAYDAERLDHPRLSRVARCLLGLGPHPEDPGQSAAVLDECTRLGDREGAALAALAECLRSVRAGRPSVGRFEEAVRRFRALGWGVVEAWCRAALAVVETGRDLPDAAQRAAQAEAFARSADVPGARALAMGAMALAVPEAAGRAELQEAARSTARSAGLPEAALGSWLAALAPSSGQAADGPGTDRPRAGSSRSPAPGTEAAEPVPGVTVLCFGCFEFTVAGREPDWPQLRPKARAVLRLLAVRAGRPVHRNQLLSAFWDGLPPASALHNLQVTVSSLRTFLEPERPRGGSRLIVRQGDSYRLALPPGSVSDVAAFERAVRDGRRARAQNRPDDAADAFRLALDQYTGELLPEEGPAEWLAIDRERLRREAAGSAVALAELRLGQSRPADAVEAAELCLEIDGFRDAAWRVLIRACEQAGLAADSARARRGYADMLASLGLPPSASIPHPA
ncbi:BTAD domain-containing putative transcriptional regulator [Streptomyces sp. NPDC052236]|uniref:BTAD domain-containing putative transcriptional regulator n=1 Tax=Streptomyces sp. NPDC052236 TaxID=3365686 RepID=UPI0037CCE0A4